jgi:hypothetical protein
MRNLTAVYTCRGILSNVITEDFDPYTELVSERSPYLFCDVCMYYPIEPVHGHFMCPACRNVTKCCEGAPIMAASAPRREEAA